MKSDMPIKSLQDLIQNNMQNFWKLSSKTKHICVEHSSEYIATVSSIPDALFNSVLSAEFSEDNADNAIEKIARSYKDKELSFCWWVGPNSTPYQLGDRLAKHNFQLFGEIQGMAIDLNAAEFKPELQEELKIHNVTTSKDLDDWIQPLAISFHMSDVGAKTYKQIFGDLLKISDDVRHLIAYKDSIPVASCTLFLDKESKSAGIYNCATIPEARKKGIVTALAYHSLATASKAGYKTCVLQASPMSMSLFEKIGLECFTSYQLYFRD